MLGLIRRHFNEMAGLAGIDLMVASDLVDKLVMRRRRAARPEGAAAEGDDRHSDRGGQRGAVAQERTRETGRRRARNIVDRLIEFLAAGGAQYRGRVAEHLHRLAE